MGYSCVVKLNWKISNLSYHWAWIWKIIKDSSINKTFHLLICHRRNLSFAVDSFDIFFRKAHKAPLKISEILPQGISNDDKPAAGKGEKSDKASKRLSYGRNCFDVDSCQPTKAKPAWNLCDGLTARCNIKGIGNQAAIEVHVWKHPRTMLLVPFNVDPIVNSFSLVNHVVKWKREIKTLPFTMHKSVRGRVKRLWLKISSSKSTAASAWWRISARCVVVFGWDRKTLCTFVFGWRGNYADNLRRRNVHGISMTWEMNDSSEK